MNALFSAGSGAFWRLAFRVALCLGCLGSALLAQVPTEILAVKLHDYRQTSATVRELVGAYFAFGVDFAPVPTASVTVQLRSPAGVTVALERESAGRYQLVRDFPTPEALEASFPDGVYALTVTGATTSTLNLSINTGATVPPVLVTNFDALQSWPDTTPQIRWERIDAPATVATVLSLVISRGEEELYSSPEDFSPGSTFAAPTNMPPFTPLTGDLSFARLSSAVINNGATTLAAGRGFNVGFPLLCRPAPPAIAIQPVAQVGVPGESVRFSVIPSGLTPFTYQWKKDGVPIAGATNYELVFANVQAANAGTYTVDVSNPGGRVTSEPALLGVMSVYKFSLQAGVPGRFGSGDGLATSARFGVVADLALAPDGTIYVSDAGNSTIRKIAPDGTVTTLAGLAGAQGSADGAGTDARFTAVGAMTLDAAGNIYVCDGGGIRRVTPGGVVTTLAGSVGQHDYRDAVGAAARFRGPNGIAVDAAGNAFVSDSGNHVIRRITPAGVVSTLAGLAGTRGEADGVGASARFLVPSRMAIDRSGVLHVIDGGRTSIRTVTPGGQVRTFLANWPGFPEAIAVDSAGSVYLGSFNSFVRLSPEGTVNARISYPVYQDITGSFSYFSPSGIVVRADGSVLVSDAYNYAVLKGALLVGSSTHGIAVAANPQSHVVATGGSAVLTANATGPSLSYQWRKDGVTVPGGTRSSLYIPTVTPENAGVYSVVISNGIGAVVAAPATLSVIAGGGEPSRLINLSIRGRAGAGAQTLTVGAVVGGAHPTSSAPLLVRAVGPGLQRFGVDGALTDPALTVYRGGQIVAMNDNWGPSTVLAQTFASVGAFPLGDGSRDAALSSSFSPSAYSFQIVGNSGATGIALAELYDASGGTGNPARLVNLSTRAEVGTGADILIAGFVLSGNTSKTLLIRGVGESLLQFGVSGVLSDPQLRLFSGGRLVASNDNWMQDFWISNAARSVGAFALEWQRDAALLVTLQPGSYSVQVSGVGDTTGGALIEVYDVP